MNKAMGLEALDREELIFHAAVQLRDPGKRALYLDWACEGSPELRVRIEKLLANDRGDNFFTQPLASPATLNRLPPEALSATVQEQGAGERIGRYKLLQKIGEGGCGAVYMAEQEEPVRRRVALKIIRLGMDTRSVIARFEAERQALAMMDHPNIAKILDGGVTDTGRPYFVMDLVQGLPIIQFCDEAQLPTKERLALFMEVCSAIQHAHQKGIIHRDIKPSNILVTLHGEKPVPKVIDFGIAKATQHRLTDKTVFTQFQQFIGTPAYMSPEQATLSGLDIDTRSDIYSLGVLLYELLTGKTPFESKELLQAGVDEMCRTIREKEPPTPSTRVSIMGAEEVTTTAKCRGLEAPKLLSQLRGDLDWIIMKCLEKDRARRYETANGLAMDIQRYLNNEPVVARPPSQFYRLQKLMRRNRLLFAAGGVIATVLLLGVMVSAWQAVRARRAEHEQQRLRLAALAEKNKAEREAAKSRQEARLLQDMLASVGPSKALGRDTTMLREILDKTVERIGKELAEQPEVQIELSATIADTYHELGLYRRAETLARANVAMAKTCFGEQHWAVAQALYQLGKAQLSLGNIEQSEASLRQALALRRKLFGEQNLEVAASLAQLARALDYQWKWAEGESLYRQALDLRQKLQGPENPEVASSLHGLGLCLMRQAQPFRMSSVAETNLTGLFRRDKLNEAEACLRQSVAIKQKVLGAEHPDLASSLNVLATVLVLRGKLATAEDYYRQAWKLHRKLVGEQHPDTLLALRNLADVLRREGKSADLDEVCEQLLGMKQRLLADENPASTDPLINVGVALEEQAKFAEAEELYRRALVLRRKLGDEHPSVAQTVQGLLANLIEQNKFTEADAFLVGTVGPLLKAHQGCEPLLRARAYFLVHRGRWKEAIEDFAKAITLDPSDHMLYVSIISLLAAEGRLDEYSQYCQAVTTRFAGTQDGPTAERLAKACLILPPTARELSRACTLAEMAVKRNTHPAQCCWTSFCMGLAEYRRGRFESAETWAQQTLAQAGMLVESYGIEGEAYALLALCRCQLGRKGDARIAAAECAEVISQRAPDLNRGDPGPDWTDVLYSQTLLKQARALIRENESAGSQGTFGVTNSEADLR